MRSSENSHSRFATPSLLPWLALLAVLLIVVGIVAALFVGEKDVLRFPWLEPPRE